MTMMTMMNNNNYIYLAHHGTLGQKWGVRRYQNKDGSLTAAGRARYQKGQSRAESREARKLAVEKERLKRLKVKQQIQAEKQKAKPPKETNRVSKMSDEELNKRIERLNLEKKYRDLKADMSGVTPGKKLVSDIATSAIKNIGTQALTYAIGTALNRVFKEKRVTQVKGDDGKITEKVEFLDIVNPRKGQKDK